MTDVISTAGTVPARYLSPVAIVPRGNQAPESSGDFPRQEWLAAKVSGNGPSMRLVGQKVLAQGPGRADPYARRAIAIFSQQLGGYTAAKGTRIDIYA